MILTISSGSRSVISISILSRPISTAEPWQNGLFWQQSPMTLADLHLIPGGPFSSHCLHTSNPPSLKKSKNERNEHVNLKYGFLCLLDTDKSALILEISLVTYFNPIGAMQKYLGYPLWTDQYEAYVFKKSANLVLKGLLSYWFPSLHSTIIQV